jgi:hypothetical protein
VIRTSTAVNRLHVSDHFRLDDLDFGGSNAARLVRGVLGWVRCCAILPALLIALLLVHQELPAQVARTALPMAAIVMHENGGPNRNGYAMNIWTGVDNVFAVCGDVVILTYQLRPTNRGYAGDAYWYDGTRYTGGTPVYAASLNYQAVVTLRGRSLPLHNPHTSFEQELGTCGGHQSLRIGSMQELFGPNWTEADYWSAVNTGTVWQVGPTPPLRNWDLEMQIAQRLGKDLEEERARQQREQLAEQLAAERARRASAEAAALEAERQRLQQEILAARQQREQQARDEQQNGRLQGRITDALTRSGIGGAAVSIEGGSTSVTATTSSDGAYQSPLLPPGSYTISVHVEGYQPASLFDAEIERQAISEVASIPLVPASDQPGTISGVVRNARNASAMPDVTVQLRTGVGARSGTVVSTASTNSSGQYRFSGLAAGTYSVTAAVPEYVQGIITGISVGGTEVANQDVLLSPVGSENEIRIVLSWGEHPSDLDSHLYGPNGNGGRFHINYRSKGSLDSAPNAGLDVDDTSSFGPETITVTRQHDGRYRYSVHHYGGSGTISRSGAVVQVYRGSTLLGRFEPPSGGSGQGDVWNVFELEGRNLRPINNISRSFPE